MTPGLSWWRRVLVADAGRLDTARRAPGAERYLLLPTASDPRVVVDADSTPAVAEALRRFAAARSLPGIIGSTAGRLAPVAAKVAPGWALTMEPGQRSLREHLCEVLGQDVRLSIAVGPPRPNRKPVIRCWVGRDLVAVAKLGPDPHTEGMVRNEAEWLRRLADDPIDGVLTPEPLYHGRYGESELLVMSVLPLVSDAGVSFDQVPADRLAIFVDRCHSADRGLGASPWWIELQTRLASVNDAEVSNAIERARTDSVASGVETSAWHGDWSPWNVGRSTDGRWCIWDWERAALGVPIGFDQLHLHHQYGAGLSAADSAIGRLGVASAHLPLLRRLYLLELTARHAESGSLQSNRHQTVLQLLREDAEGREGTVARAEGAT